MKISTTIWMLTIVLLAVSLSLAGIIYTNSQKMKELDEGMMHNVDALQQLADIRGFSSRIHIILHEDEIHANENTSFDPNILFNQFVAMNDHYTNAVEEFKKIAAETESGESGISSEEKTEEQTIMKNALSSAIQLSEQLKQYSQTKLEADEPEHELFETVFEDASIMINQEKKNYDIFAKETTRLDNFNVRLMVPFSFISVLLVLAILSFLLIKIVAPLKKMTEIINDISLGKIGQEIDPKLKESKNEIGDLARAFERTMVSLKLAMKKVEKEKPKLEEPEKSEEKLKKAFKV